MCPDPTAVFFGDSYVNHRDHREVGWAVVDAVAPAAASPLHFPEAGALHQVQALLLSGNLQADAGGRVRRGRGQGGRGGMPREPGGSDPTHVAELLRARLAETGAPAGVDHAESFRLLRFA